MIRRVRRDGREARRNEEREKRERIEKGSRKRIEKRERDKSFEEKEGLRDPSLFRIF